MKGAQHNRFIWCQKLLLMHITINDCILEVVKGDITEQDVDAIVNAANPRLTPGGGVSGAIHRAAGPELWEECRMLGGCRTGEAKITKGYRLPARYVIHTVGPVYRGREEDAAALAACYENSLKLALDHGITSIAFPAISTGIYGYPLEEAARVALRTIISFLRNHTGPERVRMVLYDEASYEVHRNILHEVAHDIA